MIVWLMISEGVLDGDLSKGGQMLQSKLGPNHLVVPTCSFEVRYCIRVVMNSLVCLSRGRGYVSFGGKGLAVLRVAPNDIGL